MLVGTAVLAALTFVGFTLHASLSTVCCLYLILVFFVAQFSGFWAASFISVFAVVSLDYFFTTPLFHFYIDNPQDWVSLATFEMASLLITRLSARELRNAKEAAAHRAELEKLYELSRNSLALDLRQPPGAQLALLMHRIFHLDAIALFDSRLSREDRAGEWLPTELDIAKRFYIDRSIQHTAGDRTQYRILHANSAVGGAMVLRGNIGPVVTDALAAMAAMAFDRCQAVHNEERAENAMRTEELRAAVMDSLAHEIKTPLSSVQMATAGILEFGGLDPTQAEFVSIIDQETQRITALCTRLLLTSRLDSSRSLFKSEEVKIRDLIEDVLASRAMASDTKRLHVLLEQPDLAVRADRSMLTTILSQYVDNARKYATPETPIEIVARKSFTEALFSVHNYGPVIPMEDRERVFERFYRSPGTTETAPGTGIGLSVARKAAAAHHGHVWVVSDKTQGTTFFLSIPIEERTS